MLLATDKLAGRRECTKRDWEDAMKPTTQQHVWQGWLSAQSMPANGTKYQLTWDEWCARQRQHQHRQPQQARRMGPRPRRHEVAARAFLMWFDAAIAAPAGRYDSLFDDRELAVRRSMHGFAEVAATLDPFSGTELAQLRRRHLAGTDADESAR